MRSKFKKPCEICNDEVEQEVESQTAEVIRTIQSCVDRIRDAFPPSTTKQYLQRPSNPVIILAETSKRELLSRVKSSCRAVDDIFVAWARPLNLELPGQEIFPSVSDLTVNECLDERTTLIRCIILPLFLSLWKCYSILDQSATPPPTNSNVGKGKPTPPRGLLSLQAYSDIAALLEFLVCHSVLPLLDPNVLHSSEQRARVLPKAIAGRLPRHSLCWGTTNHSDSTLASPTLQLQELSWTVTIVGNLVLLDRFRPMLLPRHLSDLHAAIFQLEHNTGGATMQSFPGVEALHSKLLPSSDCAVDAVLLARSYQVLLLHGTLAPVWLRTRVGKLLTDVARTNLTALIQVFVATAPEEHAGGASLRLARAILHSNREAISKSRQSPAVDGSLDSTVCHQIAQLLDTLAGSKTICNSLPQESVLQTIWALIDLLPWSTLLEEHLVTVTHSVDAASTFKDTNVAAQRLVALFSFVPPFASTDKIFRLLFAASSSTGINTLDLLVAQASTPCVLHSSPKANSLHCLQLLVSNVPPQISSREGFPTTGYQVLAAAFVYSLSFSHSIFPDSPKTDLGPTLEFQSLAISMENSDNHVGNLVQDLQQGAKTLVQDVLAPLLQRAETENDMEQSIDPLLSSVFMLLLELYLKGNPTIPSVAVREALPFVPLVALPILCEQCPVESLLRSHDTAGVLELMAIAFDAASARVNDESVSTLSHSAAPCSVVKGTRDVWDVFASLLLPQSDASTPQETTKPTQGLVASADVDMMFSICSVLLSMLIGILELGSVQRHQKDEDILGSLPPKLLPLATVSDAHASVQVPTELANMATHAATLILARQATQFPAFDHVIEAEHRNARVAKLAQIELDLHSSSVPLRARALVQLRHVAIAWEDLKSETPDNGVLKALHLSLRALLDPDSYVYLAAIQTIALLADAKPGLIVPILGKAVSIGVVEFVESTNQRIQLSTEQRVKLAEAIISFLRRKAAVNEFLPVLMDMMAFGGPRQSFCLSPEHGALIQKTTHDYFTTGSSGTNNSLGDDVSENDKWEGIDTRVLSGGPLFSVEESELVQAAKLSVVAELVSTMEPCITSYYCGVLVKYSIDSVRLGVSRPVRRAGALLARELFAAMIREQEEQRASGPSGQVPFAVSMVASHEDWLATALQRCLQQHDLNDLSYGKQRFGDSATEARCKEALGLRASAEKSGILPASRLLHTSKDPAISPFLFETLREPSREVKGYQATIQRTIEMHESSA